LLLAGAGAVVMAGAAAAVAAFCFRHLALLLALRIALLWVLAEQAQQPQILQQDQILYLLA
jgi:hypothetical protein